MNWIGVKKLKGIAMKFMYLTWIELKVECGQIKLEQIEMNGIIQFNSNEL